jgi:hypothetical protein
VRRAAILLAIAAAACGNGKHKHEPPPSKLGSATGSATGSAGSAAAVDDTDWTACSAALRQAATAPLDNRPQLLIDGCKVCGDWTPILKWSTPAANGGPSRQLIMSAMERCHAYCNGQARQQFLGTLDNARDTSSRAPWHHLGTVCKADVSALPDDRFEGAPLFALDRIARAAAAHGGEPASLALAIELPLPAVSLTGSGITIPDVETEVNPTAGPIAITITGGAAYVAKLPRAHLTATGLAVDLGGYPGDVVKPDKLADAITKLADPNGGIVSISILAPTATPAEQLVPIVAAAAKLAPVYLAANAANTPDGWDLPGNIPVALDVAAKGDKDGYKITHELTVQNLATELAQRSKAGVKKLALVGPK